MWSTETITARIDKKKRNLSQFEEERKKKHESQNNNEQIF